MIVVESIEDINWNLERNRNSESFNPRITAGSKSSNKVKDGKGFTEK
jgi:hypothetical protein